MIINGKEFRHVIDHGDDMDPLVDLFVKEGLASYDDESHTLTFFNDKNGYPIQSHETTNDTTMS